MKVILIEWNSYGDIRPALVRRGHQVIPCPWDTHAIGEAVIEQENRLREMLLDYFGEMPEVEYTKAETTKKSKFSEPGYVFSFNYYPKVSIACQEAGVPYLAWIYDSPYYDLYDVTVANPVNRIFVFDYGVFERFQKGGIATVYYLPLGVDALGCQAKAETDETKTYSSDISFVGSLYSEPKHRLYDKFASLSPYAKGYLEAIMEAQKQVYGDFLLERLLPSDILQEMEQAYPMNPAAKNIMTPAQLYSEFVLARQVTAMERKELLTAVGEVFGNDSPAMHLHLYTHESSLELLGWKNLGPADYYTEMPGVFASSRINLNITLRSIFTGIPLRALDIMAAGGFLLTNYQAEIPEYFVPGEDLVVFESKEDLLCKIDYYLTHEEERAAIAKNGQEKVLSLHTYDLRIAAMEETL